LTAVTKQHEMCVPDFFALNTSFNMTRWIHRSCVGGCLHSMALN